MNDCKPTKNHFSRCGFRAERSTVDMIFSLRQLQEKCREQQKPLFIAFIDLSKAFDLVSRDGLFNILLKIGCPLNLHSMIRSFHDDMKATIQYEGSMSKPFKSGVSKAASLPRHSLASSSPSFSIMPLGPRPKECTCIQDQMASCTTSQDSEQRPRSAKPP